MQKSAANMGMVTTLALTLGACSTLGVEASNAELEISPVLTKDDAPLDLDGAITQAQAQRKSGDLTAAIRTLSQLVLIAPDDPRVVGEYGKTLVAKGQTDDAIAFLSRAMELQPGDWTIFSALGVAYDQRTDFASAQMAYNRALELKPGEPVTLSNAGLSRMQAGDIDNAERLLLQAIEAGGDYPRITQNLALIQNLKRARTPVLAPASPQQASVIGLTTAQPVASVDEPTHAAAPSTVVAAPPPVTQDVLPPLQPVEQAASSVPATATAEPVPLDPILAIAAANAEANTSGDALVPGAKEPEGQPKTVVAKNPASAPPSLRLRPVQ